MKDTLSKLNCSVKQAKFNMWQYKKHWLMTIGTGSNSSFPKWNANNGNVNRRKKIEGRDKNWCLPGVQSSG